MNFLNILNRMRTVQKNSDTFGQRLRQARERAGMSQKELAVILGVSQPAIVRWEKDLSSIRLDPLMKILQAFNIAPEELLGPYPNRKKSGPTRKLARCFEKASTLPKKQQERVTDVVEALIERYENTAS